MDDDDLTMADFLPSPSPSPSPRVLDGVHGDVRLEVVGGWLGAAWNPDAKVWTVLTTVYETRDGLDASPHWWALRRPVRFNEPTTAVVYDDAV